MFEAAQHRGHARAAANTHDAGSTLSHAVLVNALEEALAGWQRVSQRPIHADDTDNAQQHARHQEQHGARQQRQELERGDTHPVGRDSAAVRLGHRVPDAEADNDHPDQQNQNPARDMQPEAQKLEHFAAIQLKTRDATKLTAVTTSAPMNAAPKSTTCTPTSNWLASQNTIALTTSVKSPRVSRVSGSVSSSKIGRRKALSTPRIRPKMTTATRGSCSRTSINFGKIAFASNTAAAVASRRKTKRCTALAYGF